MNHNHRTPHRAALTLRRAARLLAGAALLLLAACGTPKDRARIEGSISNVRDAEFYVYSEDGAFDGIDTIRIENGEFTYERPLQAPAVLTLLYPNFSRTYVVAEPGRTVSIKGDAARLGEADITGTEENELLTAFRQRNAGKKPADLLLAASDFVRSNARTLAAVAVFRKYFADAEAPDAPTTRSLLGELRRAQPRNAALAALARRLHHINLLPILHHLPSVLHPQNRISGKGVLHIHEFISNPAYVLLGHMFRIHCIGNGKPALRGAVYHVGRYHGRAGKHPFFHQLHGIGRPPVAVTAYEPVHLRILAKPLYSRRNDQ